MKKSIFIFLCVILMVSCSIDDKKSNYALDWQGNNLCVIMPHPTMGIISPGLIDWRGVELSDVVENIYNELMKTDFSGNVSIWVRFEMSEHDKYGNQVISYDDHFLVDIPVSEAKKYKSGNYLDLEYHIKDHIRQSAFPTDVYSPYVTVTAPHNPYSGGYSNNTTNQTTVPVVPVAPTDTLTDIFD